MRRIGSGAFLALILLASFMITACRDDSVLRDMVSLDRAFIPALMGTSSGGNAERAVMAVKDFKLQWLVFAAKYSSFGGSDHRWGRASDRIGEMMERADGSVMVGDMKAAHSELVGIQAELRALRRHYGIEYFPDYLAEFNPMAETVAEALRDGTLSPVELEAIDRGLPEAITLWRKVEAAEVDAGLYGLDNKGRARMEDCIQEERLALEGLRDSLARNDREAARREAQKVGPAFSDLMMLFGEFQEEM